MSDPKKVIQEFLTNNDWSISAANELEAQMNDHADEAGIQDLLDILASYRPGGGEYLYNKADLEKILLWLIASLPD